MANYYVKPDGNDGLDGHTTENAWQHPSYAAQEAIAGDTILLMDGIWYDEHIVFANSGTKDNPIVLTAYNGTPTLDGVDKTDYGITLWNGASYINITGNLNIKNYQHGIWIDRHSWHINIIDITITSTPLDDTTAAGIRFYPNCSYITVDSATITYTGGGAVQSHCFRDEYTNHHITITNNYMEDNNHDAINIFNNAHDVLIENNTIVNASYGAAIMVHNWNCKDITIRNNTIVDSTRGISLCGVNDCLVEDNTILDCYSYDGILVIPYDDNRSGVHNVTIRNNIVKNSAIHDIHLMTNLTDLASISNITFVNNSITETFGFDGQDISNIAVKNIPDATQTLKIIDPVSNLLVEMTDGGTFKINNDEGGHIHEYLTGVGAYVITSECPKPKSFYTYNTIQ